MTLSGTLRILGLGLLVALVAVLGLRFGRQILARAEPSALRLAISRTDGTDGALLRAFAGEIRDRGLRPQLEIIEVADSREAARALAGGSADLAVVRPDVETPNSAAAVVRMRSAPLVLVSRKNLEISRLADLEGKVVGTDARDSGIIDEVNAIFSQSQRQPITRKPITAAEIETLLTRKQVDVVLFTPSLAADRAGPALVRKLAASGSAFRVSAVAPDDVSALINALPAIGTAESALPSVLRNEDVEEVVCAQYIIMARNAVSSGTIATFTERLFSMRPAIAKRAGRPATFGAVAGESVTANTIPLHKGAIEYYEREQKTFLERHSDEIWLGMAFSGMVSSIFAWFFRRVDKRRTQHLNNAIEDLKAFSAKMRHVSDAGALAVHEEEFDELSARIIDMARSGELEDGDLAATRLALDHARFGLEAVRARLSLPLPPALHGET